MTHTYFKLNILKLNLSNLYKNNFLQTQIATAKIYLKSEPVQSQSSEVEHFILLHWNKQNQIRRVISMDICHFKALEKDSNPF